MQHQQKKNVKANNRAALTKTGMSRATHQSSFLTAQCPGGTSVESRGPDKAEFENPDLELDSQT